MAVWALGCWTTNLRQLLCGCKRGLHQTIMQKNIGHPDKVCIFFTDADKVVVFQIFHWNSKVNTHTRNIFVSISNNCSDSADIRTVSVPQGWWSHSLEVTNFSLIGQLIIIWPTCLYVWLDEPTCLPDIPVGAYYRGDEKLFSIENLKWETRSCVYIGRHLGFCIATPGGAIVNAAWC